MDFRWADIAISNNNMGTTIMFFDKETKKFIAVGEVQNNTGLYKVINRKIKGIPDILKGLVQPVDARGNPTGTEITNAEGTIVGYSTARF